MARVALAADDEVVVMAGMGRYPKDDDSRRNRNERAFDWTVLPLEGRPGSPPALPALRQWGDATHAWWSALWATPQAVMWDQTGRTLHTLAILHHQLMVDELLPAAASRAASIAAEMRQHEDRHGLTPKAMLQLRWKVSTTPSDGTGKVLSIVPKNVAARVAANEPDPTRLPAKRAGKQAWVDWAVLCGWERSTAEHLTKEQLIEHLSSRASRPTATPSSTPPTSSAVARLRESAKSSKPPGKPKPKGKGRRKS